MSMSNLPDTDPLMREVMKSLAVRVQTSEDSLTRRHAIYLLAMTRNPACAELFTRALRDPEKAVRAQAARALADIGEPASGRLIELLRDPDWKVRYRAAEALGMIKERTAVGPLIGLLSDEKDHVRYMAVKSLGAIGPAGSKHTIEAMLNDENNYVRDMAEEVLRREE